MKKRKIFVPKMIIRENKKRNKGEDHHFYRKKKMENTKEVKTGKHGRYF